MILVLARRSLFAHPVRSAVLAAGFGLGVAVMASLLGIGEVILAQARAPALRGGGDVTLVGAGGEVPAARFVLSSLQGSPALAVASPMKRQTLYLVRQGRVVPIRTRGGVPSLEKKMRDPETAAVAAWTDTPADAAWAAPDPAAVLRAMDRFHAMPAVPARAASWAEWLYFNGRAGDTRFYLTFLVGPSRGNGRRAAGVRLQLEEGGRMRSWSDGGEVDEAKLLAEAPDLDVARCRVRLDGLRYRLSVDLPEETSTAGRGPRGRIQGELSLVAVPGRSLPPFTVRGAAGWLTGYVVPVTGGALEGGLRLGGRTLVLDGGKGYHDHNWGFWEGMTWQWGQVQYEDLSFVYGRIRPPADAADPDRLPGFLGVLGPSGPMGYATDVVIEETSDPASGRPQHIAVRARGPSLSLTLDLDVEQGVATAMPVRAFGAGMDFLQLRARYRVAGQLGERRIAFEAMGAAETFRGK